MLGRKPKLKTDKAGNLEETFGSKDETQLQAMQDSALDIAAVEKDVEKEKDTDIYSKCYSLVAKRISFLFPRLITLEKKIKSAGMTTHYEAYVCALVVLSTVMGILGLVIGIVISLVVNLQPPAFATFLPIILGSALGQGTFAFMYYYPSLAMKGRISKINAELPYYIGYMSTLSASGLTVEGVFKELAKEDAKEEIVKDAKFIIRNLELLGQDILTALKELVERTPAGPYAELLEGLISTTESGGNLKSYFIATAKVQMEEKKMLLQKMTASLGIVAELYTILLIVFPLLSIIMLSIMAIMTPKLAGFSLLTLMMLLTYAFVPFLGVMMLVLIDSMVPKR